MDLNTVSYKLCSTSRENVRKEVVGWFLSEQPGSGTGELSSKYRYDVEEYKNYKIYLMRPAPLNKGFDFIVRIDGVYFKKNRRYNNPGHNDIIVALNYIKENASDEIYKKITQEIHSIYIKNEFDECIAKDIYFSDYEGSKHPINIILYAIKWLFIEQDITYWNWSGRKMLMSHIENANLL